jgi:hypothetical protein
MSVINVTVTNAGAANVSVSNGSTVSATVGNGGAVNVSTGTISPGNATVVSGTLAINSVTTLAAGSQAYVKNDLGTAFAAKLDIGIPAGPATLVSVGNTTTLSPGSNATVSGVTDAGNLTLSFGIPSGTNGTNGTNGVTPSFAIGNVVTGAAGSSALVTATTTNSGANVTLDLTIPRGDTGSSGENGTSVTLSSATPSALGTAAAGSSTLAARGDHVHALPVISYANLSGVPSTFAPSTHTHTASQITDLSTSAATSVAGRTGDVVISTTDIDGLTDALANVNVDIIDGGDYVGVVVVPTPSITITAQPQGFSGTVGTASAQTGALPSGSWNPANFSYGNDLYWLTSSNSSSGDYYAVSSDGLNWTKRYGLNRPGLWNAAVHGGGKIAITNGSHLQVSSDGTTWTESAVSGKVFFANGKWFRYAGPASVTSQSAWNSLTLYQSDDLASWSTAGTVSKTFTSGSFTNYHKPANGTLSGIVYFGGKYIAFFDEDSDTRFRSGDNTYIAGFPWVFTSSDLSTWTAVLGGPVETGWVNDFYQSTANSSFRLQWSNPRIINSQLLVDTKASSSGGKAFARTSDGTNWDTQSNFLSQSGNSYYSVAHGNGVYVMPAGAKIYSSANATTWVERTNPTQTSFNVAFFVDGNFWLISRDSTSSVALRSSNGIDWTAVTGLPSIDATYLVQNGSTLVASNVGTATQYVRLSLSGSAVQATFSVSAFFGSATVSYQWQLSTDAGTTFTDISGATLPTLSFSATAADNGKRYRCVLSATGASSVTSNSATLTVT